MHTHRAAPSKVKQILKNGGAVTVPYVGMIAEPYVIELLGLLDYPCAWVCMEHTDLSYEKLSALTRAARISGLDVIVRIDKSGDGYTRITRPLEAGVRGLMYPHCRSAEEARTFVRDAKFSPLGHRAVSGEGADALYGTVEFSEYIKHANEETLLMVQIEDRQAVEAVDSIAAVEGIDVLYVGKYDLSQSYGVIGKTDDPMIAKAIDAVAAACRKHNKSWGITSSTGQYHREMLKKGARFNCVVGDIGVLTSGFKKARELGEQDYATLAAACL